LWLWLPAAVAAEIKSRLLRHDAEPLLGLVRSLLAAAHGAVRAHAGEDAAGASSASAPAAPPDAAERRQLLERAADVPPLLELYEAAFAADPTGRFFADLSASTDTDAPLHWRAVEVVPGLFIGDSRDAVDAAALRTNKIAAVFNLDASRLSYSAANDAVYELPEMAAAVGAGFEYVEAVSRGVDEGRVCVLASVDRVVAAVSALRSSAAGGAVLLVCSNGAEHSAAVAMAVILALEAPNTNLIRAARAVVRARGKVAPSAALRYQLIGFAAKRGLLMPKDIHISSLLALVADVGKTAADSWYARRAHECCTVRDCMPLPVTRAGRWFLVCVQLLWRRPGG
jgi:hypothetical protein